MVPKVVAGLDDANSHPRAYDRLVVIGSTAIRLRAPTVGSVAIERAGARLSLVVGSWLSRFVLPFAAFLRKPGFMTVRPALRWPVAPTTGVSHLTPPYVFDGGVSSSLSNKRFASVL